MRSAAALLFVSLASASCGAPAVDRASEDLTEDACDARSGAESRSRLLDEIRDHVALKYGPARGAMYAPADGIDVHDGVIECVYTGVTVVPDGTWSPPGFNTEHSWPQSKGAGEEPARSDLHHLFPVETEANTVRGSVPFGDTSCDVGGGDGEGEACDWQAGGSALGRGDGDLVFEVRPERRGDVARAQFYFAVRYELAIDGPSEVALRRWHDEDPPDAREIERNRRIEALQGNRNPFVDEPDLAAEICDF